jgi:hypothetical protein
MSAEEFKLDTKMRGLNTAMRGIARPMKTKTPLHCTRSIADGNTLQKTAHMRLSKPHLVAMMMMQRAIRAAQKPKKSNVLPRFRTHCATQRMRILTAILKPPLRFA